MTDLFDKLRKNIDKNMKGLHATTMAESDIATERYWVKTPAMDLNRILSGSIYKGLQSRNLIGIVGPEHTMKSSFMILCMVEAQKQGKKVVIIDTEGAINKDFCLRWGLNPENTYYIYTPFVGEVRSVLGQIRSTGETDYIIGLDSVGGLDRGKQFEDAEKGEMHADQGLLQKEIRSMLKLFLNICIAQNSIGIVTGHLYGAPSTVPMPDQIGGGKAMRLFPSILIQLFKRPIWEDPKNKKSKIIGTSIEATTLKNRIYPPFQKATVNLNYVDGIDSYAGLLDLGIDAEIIKQAGAWYSYKDEKLGQGVSNAIEKLKDIPDILDDIDNWLSETGYSTVSQEIKEAEELIQTELEKGK